VRYNFPNKGESLKRLPGESFAVHQSSWVVVRFYPRPSAWYPRDPRWQSGTEFDERVLARPACEHASFPRNRTMNDKKDRDLAFLTKGLRLRIYPDEVLRMKCEPVAAFDSSLSDIADEMQALMKVKSGIGLAAPQVGIRQRFFVYKLNGLFGCLINPVLKAAYLKGVLVEGCLSLPGIQVAVLRPQLILVEGYDLKGKHVRLTQTGFGAHVFQHEMDHLDGVLIVDYG
jgi:peptide deformylase